METLLDRSSFVQLLDGSVVQLDKEFREVILKSLHQMSSSALRVLGFAYKDDLPEFATYNGDEDHPAHQLLLNPANYSSIESRLVFVGLAGLRVSWFLIYVSTLTCDCKTYDLTVWLSLCCLRILRGKKSLKQLKIAEQLESGLW